MRFIPIKFSIWTGGWYLGQIFHSIGLKRVRLKHSRTFLLHLKIRSKLALTVDHQLWCLWVLLHSMILLCELTVRGSFACLIHFISLLYNVTVYISRQTFLHLVLGWIRDLHAKVIHTIRQSGGEVPHKLRLSTNSMRKCRLFCQWVSHVLSSALCGCVTTFCLSLSFIKKSGKSALVILPVCMFFDIHAIMIQQISCWLLS